MTAPITETSPPGGARSIGVVYLLYFLTAILTGFITRGLKVSGDPAATLAHLVTHESLVRAGFAVGLVANALYVALTALFYELFKPVQRSLSLIAAFVGLIGCAVQIFGSLLQVAPLLAQTANSSLGAFNGAELPALASVFFKLSALSSHVGLVFFAFYDLLLGYLIFRSTFLPRLLGVLLVLAGLGWLTFLWPPLAASLSLVVLPLGFLAEFVLMLWLLIRGEPVRNSDPVPGLHGHRT